MFRFLKLAQIGVALSIMLTVTKVAFGGPTDPMINSASVNVATNTVTITGVNLLGSDGLGVYSVTLGTIQLTVQSASSVSITAGFPTSSPASSLTPGAYTLSVRFFSTVQNVNNYVTFIVTVGGSGQAGSAFSSVMTIEGISCSTAVDHGFPISAWTIGASNAVSGGSSGSSQAKLSDLTVNKSFDDCSALLFGLVITERHVTSATVTQSIGTTAIMTIQLRDVIADSFTLGSSAGSTTPAEVVSFNYGRIIITDNLTGSRFCWDAKLLAAC